MTDDNNTVDIDQDDFENQFFGRTSSTEASETDEPQDEVEEIEEVVENEDNSLATDDDDDEDADDGIDEDDNDDEEEVEEVPQLKQKKQTRAQKRIEKLVAEARQAERERDALKAELEKLRTNPQEEKAKEEAPALREQLPADAPNPDAVDKDGKPIYELGEFDPKYIRDLTKFTIEQETKAAKEAAAKEAHEAQLKAAQEELRNDWIEKVEKAEAELPDLREKLEDMSETFANIEPAYGEYLAMTIMSSAVGPQIMYYLSQNIGEAQKIVASGPAAATLALGRLEAKLLNTSSTQEEKRNTKQVSKAPEPPANTERARGHGGRFTVAPDTDDLNAFEREFFNRG